MIVFNINLALLVFLVAMAITILRSRQLFAVAMLFGLYSLLVAGLFMVLDAPDVAFTEAAVGTGISTVIMLVTLAATKIYREKRTPSIAPFPLVMCLMTGALLIYGTHDIASQGDPDAPQHTHVAKRFVEQGEAETGVPNLVTAVLASYRGFDTLGEVTVVFSAGIAVMLLLVREKKPRVKAPSDEVTGGSDGK